MPNRGGPVGWVDFEPPLHSLVQLGQPFPLPFLIRRLLYPLPQLILASQQGIASHSSGSLPNHAKCIIDGPRGGEQLLQAVDRNDI